MKIEGNDVVNHFNEVYDGFSLGEKYQFSIEAEREMGRRSTFYLAKYILGYDRLTYQFHKFLADFFDNNFLYNQLHLHPRGHFKTTIVTISGNIRHALIDPDVTIGIMANNSDNAGAFVSEMKEHFISNDKFRSLYPEHAVNKTKYMGTTRKFTTPARRKIRRVPTFMGFGAETAITSNHFIVLHFDDLVDEDSVTSQEMMDKIYQHYADSLAVASINKDGLPWHRIIGTHWDYYDPYARIRKDNQGRNDFAEFITPAEWNDDENNHHILFPEEYPQNRLDFLRKKQGDYRFSCLYLNTPNPIGQAAMDPSKIGSYDANIKIVSPLNKLICVDAAASVKTKKGDYTVISVFSMDCLGNIRVQEMYIGQWPLDEIVNILVEIHKRTNIRRMAVETGAFQDWLGQTLEKVKREKGVHFKIERMKRSPHQKKKGEGGRQERIITWVNDYKILLNEELKNQAVPDNLAENKFDYILKEMQQWPYGRMDHFLDTLADAIELLKPPAKVAKNKVDYSIPPVIWETRRHFQTGYTYRSYGGPRWPT